MEDSSKTKAQLLQELTVLRQQVAYLEAITPAGAWGERPRHLAHGYADLLVETVRTPLIVLDLALRLTVANAAFYRTFQTTPHDTLGRLIYELGNGQWDMPQLRMLLEEVLPKDAFIDDFEVTHAFDHLGHRTFLLNARRLTHVDLILLAFEDITIRKHAEEALRQACNRLEKRAQRQRAALRQSQAQMRRLAQHYHEHQEHDRARMAREIHDEVAQALAGLRLDLAWLAEHEIAHPDTPARLQAMTAQLDELDHSVRRIAMELRPRLLDDLGLVAAIEWQLREVHQRTGLTYVLQAQEADVPLDPSRTTALFRLFQEAVTNVVRHARASRVEVRMLLEPEAVRLEVIDNGRGITPGQLHDRNALGLLGMRERVQLFGGEITIEGHPGLGTTVTIWMPY